MRCTPQQGEANMTCWASIAADQHAADEDQAERRAEYVATFVQDACDEIICEDGESAYLCQKPALTVRLLSVIFADKDNAYGRAVNLRDALRAEVLKAYPQGVQLRAEKLAAAAMDGDA